MFWVYLILALALAVAGLAAFLLCRPLVVALDVRRRQMRLRWAGVLHYAGPLPGGRGEKRIYLGGFALPRRGERLPSLVEPSPPERLKRSPGRVFWRWLRNSEIRQALIREGANVGRGAFRSVQVDLRRADLSFADPALNGMLAGFRAAAAWRKPPRWSVNFCRENTLEVQLRLRPHRLAKALLLSFVRLPYRAMLRESRVRQNRKRRKR